MEASEAARTRRRPSVTGPCAECAAHWEVKDGDGEVKGGAAFSVYSSETVSPGSSFGSNASQQAATFKYYAQLS